MAENTIKVSNKPELSSSLDVICPKESQHRLHVIKTIKESKALGKNIHWFSKSTDKSSPSSFSPTTMSASNFQTNIDPLWGGSVKGSSAQGLNMECLLDLIEEWTGKQNPQYSPLPLTGNIDNTTSYFQGMDNRRPYGTVNMSVNSFDKAPRINNGEGHFTLCGQTVDTNTDDKNFVIRSNTWPKSFKLSQEHTNNVACKPIPKKIQRPKLRHSLSSEAESDTVFPEHTCSLHLPKLCQFLHKLLLTPEDYQCIAWKDKATRTFKIVKPKEVARLWGSTKNKPEMKYEHFARTLRGYVSRGLLRKPRQKLHYQFCDKFEF